MHNPRGGNDRNCESNQERNNDNLLFNSQNNENGGYPCPRAFPFACYELQNNTERAQCNAINSDQNYDDISQLNLADEQGVLHPKGTRTPKLYYYEGSTLRIEWTNQHGCGMNEKTHCDIVLQYACGDTLTDDCGEPDSGKQCGPRDGVPITNNPTERGQVTYNLLFNGGTENINRDRRDRSSTERIPLSLDYNVQSDPRFPRHETLAYYTKCYQRERNKGLWTADRNVNNDIGSTATRQQNNANRHGLECPEERDYYPYWAPSPWKDIAILTDRFADCAKIVAESQNIKEKYECVCPSCLSKNQQIPNNKGGCTAQGGTWQYIPPHGINAPVCGPPPTSVENLLGGPSSFNWTIPFNVASGSQCVLRLRYNISTGDPISKTNANHVTLQGTSSLNQGNSPLLDRQNSEAKSYKSFVEMPIETHPAARLGTAINTNQFGRTFQDRSFVFEIRKRANAVGEEQKNLANSGTAIGNTIHNLNVRGKRGDIQDVYPSVQYDFVPNELFVLQHDLVHVQWTGTDYNVNRGDGDEAIGGPPYPTDLSVSGADRHNIVQMRGSNRFARFQSDITMFQLTKEQQFKLQFIDQNLTECLTMAEMLLLNQETVPAGEQRLLNTVGNRNKYYKNCGYLSNARTPYFDAGLVRPGGMGEYHFMSTRNTVFGTHVQTAVVYVQSSLLANGSIVFAVAGLGLGTLLAGVFFMRFRKRKREMGTQNNFVVLKSALEPKPAAQAPQVPKRMRADLVPVVASSEHLLPSAISSTTVVAAHNHDAGEDGELSFKKGDRITVLRKDDSGWWEGRLPTGETGVFPANYVH